MHQPFPIFYFNFKFSNQMHNLIKFYTKNIRFQTRSSKVTTMKPKINYITNKINKKENINLNKL